MSVIDHGIALGSPRFREPRLAELARSDGALAAWHQACAQNPVEAVAQVGGDFAVGLRLPNGRTLLAVDRFAVRSLCYRIVDGQIHFAARADELADSAEIDPQAIFDYLYFHMIPSPRTIFCGVYRLPPGHCALFENGQIRIQPYWQPRFDEPRSADFNHLRDEFRRLLRASVHDALDGTKPACFLSGGTDSSTVAGQIGDIAGRVDTYSIGFDAQGYDEMEFARIAARHFKSQHHEYYVTPSDLVRSIGEVARHFDQPFGNSSALPAFYCAKMAREDGVSRLLAGDGGDELFGGNSRYAKQRIFGWYAHVPGFLQKGLMEPLLGTAIARRTPIVKKASSYVEQASVPMPDRLQMYNLILHLGVQDVLTPDFLSQVDLTAPLALQRAVWSSVSNCTPLNQELAFDWRFTLAESDLPKVTGATSLAEVDVAFPFLDERLVGFSQQLPTDYKLKGLKLRWFFKEALRGFLPDEIITKKKQGFGLPFGVWANSDAALKALATESLNSLAQRGVVRPEFIRTLLTKRLPEHPGYFGEMVWILMMLEQWLRGVRPDYRLS